VNITRTHLDAYMDINQKIEEISNSLRLHDLGWGKNLFGAGHWEFQKFSIEGGIVSIELGYDSGGRGSYERESFTAEYHTDQFIELQPHELVNITVSNLLAKKKKIEDEEQAQAKERHEQNEKVELANYLRLKEKFEKQGITA
jgi:hypothetical protein